VGVIRTIEDVVGAKRSLAVSIAIMLTGGFLLANATAAHAFNCSVADADGPGLTNALNNPGCTVINLGQGDYSSDSGFTVDHTVLINGVDLYQGEFVPQLTRLRNTGSGPVLSVTGGAPVIHAVTITGGFGGGGASVTSDGGTSNAPITLINDIVEHNYPGGIVYSGSGVLRVTDSWIVGNTSAYGGGLTNTGSGTAMIDDDVFQSNFAFDDGGAFSADTGTANTKFANVTFTENLAAHDGGAISSSASGTTTTLNNVTIAGNTAGSNSPFGGGGGGLSITGTGPLLISNSIVANNHASTASGSDCAGSRPLTRLGYELIRVPCTGGYGSNGPFIDNPAGYLAGVDPLLGRLWAQNPGPRMYVGPQPFDHPLAQTMQPGLGSPAANAGNPAAPTGIAGACEPGDERTVPRPQGAACDMGAMEVVAPVCEEQSVGQLPVSGSVPLGFNNCAGDEFVYDIVDQPTSGTVSNFDPVGGGLIYTPNPGAAGNDLLSYGGVNSGGQSNPVTFHLFLGAAASPPRRCSKKRGAAHKGTAVLAKKTKKCKKRKKKRR
jgi:predicted outer membrane repeat protein